MLPNRRRPTLSPNTGDGILHPRQRRRLPSRSFGRGGSGGGGGKDWNEEGSDTARSVTRSVAARPPGSSHIDGHWHGRSWHWGGDGAPDLFFHLIFLCRSVSRSIFSDSFFSSFPDPFFSPFPHPFFPLRCTKAVINWFMYLLSFLLSMKKKVDFFFV